MCLMLLLRPIKAVLTSIFRERSFGGRVHFWVFASVISRISYRVRKEKENGGKSFRCGFFSGKRGFSFLRSMESRKQWVFSGGGGDACGYGRRRQVQCYAYVCIVERLELADVYASDTARGV